MKNLFCSLWESLGPSMPKHICSVGRSSLLGGRGVPNSQEGFIRNNKTGLFFVVI